VLIFDEFDLEKPSSDPGARQGVVIVQTTTTNHTKYASSLPLGPVDTFSNYSFTL
jgi:hypothetical protein